MIMLLNDQGGSARDPQEEPSRDAGADNGAGSIEDQLASVMEGEGVSYAGEGIYLMARPTSIRVSKTRRRRRRSRRPAKESGVILAEDVGGRDEIANLDRVVVAFGEIPAHVFTETPVSVRYAEHERSPFVVSLREITFSISSAGEEGTILQSDILTHELEGAEGISNLELLEALASDLSVNEPDIERYSSQFTPMQFNLAYASTYGPVTQVIDRISNFFTELFSFIHWPGKRRDGPNRLSEETVIPVARSTWSYGRAIIVIVLLILVATLPANIVHLSRSMESKQQAVEAAGVSALEDIERATDADLSESIEALREASARFRAADELLSQTNALAVGLSSIIPTTRSNYRTARALLEVGSKTSDAAHLLAKGLDAALTDPHRSALDRLGVLAAYAEGALPMLDDASDAMANVDEGIVPESERMKLAVIREQIDDGRVAVREFVGLSELLALLLGREEPRRYLIVFQNPNELRPTGGFMGSYAELDVYRGEIERLVIPGGGTYDLQGQLLAQVVPPEPLTLVADRWEFQDSNWSPDFPTAAEKMRYFWSKSGGHTVDGIIAVNATVVQDLLALTGPIDIPELGKTINAQNFMIETQKSVELEYDVEENAPKKILGLMGPRLVEQLKRLPQDQVLEAMGVVSNALERKDVQVSLSDPKEDVLAQSFGWSGRLKSASGDALAVIAANIAGQKTDAAIKEHVQHTANIQADGGVLNRVVITRKHQANKGELFRGVRNVAYFRVYVPRGSTLVDASGFTEPEPIFFEEPREDAIPDPDIVETLETKLEHESGIEQWDEGDRTVFGGWSMIDPGETRELELTYRLPFTVFDIHDRIASGLEDEADAEERAAYSLLLTSQAGKPDRVVTTRVRVPDSWETRWSHAGEGLSEPWDRDKVVSALYVTAKARP